MAKCLQFKKNKILILLLLILSLILGAALFLYFRTPKEQRTDFKRINSESFDSALLSMYPVSHYLPEDFAYYRGMTLFKASLEIPDAQTLEKYLEQIAKSGNTIYTIYLGITPGQITCEELLPILQKYPSVIFEVIPAYLPMDYWLSLSEREASELSSAYESLISPMVGYENIHLFTFYAQEWFIANPANYMKDAQITEEISRLVMLNADGDHPYVFSSQNMQSVFAEFSDLLYNTRREKEAMPDLSDWFFVFFGDSIIANYTDSTSVPGVVSGLSQAQTCNYAVGGSPAAWIEDENASFPKVAKRLLADASATEFSAESNLCFVLNFGLNDYFEGLAPDNAADPYDTRTYAGALRAGIRLLQDSYPQARILVMSPSFTSYFENGTQKNGPAGGILTEYVAAAEAVSQDMGTEYIDNYTGLGINAVNHGAFLLDGCHLNEQGRFLLGRRIVNVIDHLR